MSGQWNETNGVPPWELPLTQQNKLPDHLRNMKPHTPTPWGDPEYDNTVGDDPENECFDSWWEIPGVAKFEYEEDALRALRAVNAHDELLAGLRAIALHIDTDQPITARYLVADLLAKHGGAA